ncbi:hypothetical protein [Microcoleus phage My-WqHQDG]|nr:hypothetical protein [Microcoleus phage My-WqHQDG]
MPPVQRTLTATSATRSGPAYSKSIFTSTTFWSLILLLCQAIGPQVNLVLTKGTLDPVDIWAIFQACITALVGTISRYNVGDMHTPRGVPGADPPTRKQQQTRDANR